MPENIQRQEVAQGTIIGKRIKALKIAAAARTGGFVIPGIEEGGAAAGQTSSDSFSVRGRPKGPSRFNRWVT